MRTLTLRRRRGRARPWIAALLLPTLLAVSVSATAEDWSESAVVAAYLYNFAKFVEWPRSTWTAVDQPLVIGVLGTPTLAGELAASLHGRTVQGHPVTVWHVYEKSNLRDCQMVWVDRLPPDLGQAAFFDSLDGHPILTVGHEVEFAREGGMIGLYVETDRLRFAINQAAVSRGGLKMSSKLLALAQRVDSEVGR